MNRRTVGNNGPRLMTVGFVSSLVGLRLFLVDRGLGGNALQDAQ